MFEDLATWATVFYFLSSIVFDLAGSLKYTRYKGCVQLNVTFYYGGLPWDYQISRTQALVIEGEYVSLLEPILSSTCPHIDIGSSFSYEPCTSPPHWTTTLEFQTADHTSHSLDNVRDCLENSGMLQFANRSLWRISEIENSNVTATGHGRFKISPQCCGEEVCKSMCIPNPCHFDNKCLLNGTGFACLCAPGFKGPHCEKGFDQDGEDGTINNAHRTSVIVTLVLVLVTAIVVLSVVASVRRMRKKSKASKEGRTRGNSNSAFDDPDKL